MAERLIIVGGDAAGMSAASQARRRRGPDDLEILAFERSSFVSYSACGEPYYVGGYIIDINQLQARTPAAFKAMDIDVRTQHEVITIAPREGKVTVRAVQQGTEESSALHVMLFFENLIRALSIFNGLRSRYCQRALLVYQRFPEGDKTQ